MADVPKVMRIEIAWPDETDTIQRVELTQLEFMTALDAMVRIRAPRGTYRKAFDPSDDEPGRGECAA